ncbi:RNA polymerase factor sigma-54 [Kushneria phosphatilytica]|uniref:RNA polymerase sigma-54 factor n=2 Tax=Kushneria phosphatilytica TaxID=657387 RepID=A0A1S1NXT1_9GAMM|nr:RNA polymerase factor sigma-54 [Kushneria phosphatilytica]QEL12822.1 RNA polymerase factor sigma-54 [Kushneria phosphatilytica]
MMKPSMQLRIGAQLNMTPQLQQAIALLQLSTLDLRQEIQQALESNPLLELEEDFDELELSDPRDEEWAEDIPDELALDSQWEDIYPDAVGNGSDQAPDFERNTAAETLQQHLGAQLALLTLDERDHQMAETLIDALDDSGYLSVTLDELCQGLRAQGMAGLRVSELEQLLVRLQQFEPSGVFARDLRECLLLQLAQLPSDTPHLPQTRRLIRHFLEALGLDNRKLLRRRLGVDDETLTTIIATIRTLDPRPGQRFEGAEQGYIVPDLILRRSPRDGWQLELNPDALPRLRIQPDYAALIRRADKSDDNSFLKQHLQEARWLMKSLSSRNDTLLRVGREIMLHQQAFLEHGEEAMKPLVLADIASAVEMHESTISRVTTRKYIHTPRGVFELKHFFSSHVGQEGEGHASTAIRARIKKLISDESPRKPLSDARLVSLLSDSGITVARRTIAKYRESMGIPSSSERKRLA